LFKFLPFDLVNQFHVNNQSMRRTRSFHPSNKREASKTFIRSQHTEVYFFVPKFEEAGERWHPGANKNGNYGKLEEEKSCVCVCVMWSRENRKRREKFT
jgi:hypothetical protein